jgi:hypothetical protein
MGKVDDGVVRGQQCDRVEDVDSGSGVGNGLGKSARIKMSHDTTHNGYCPCRAEDRSSVRHAERHSFHCDARTERDENEG